jgi:hypothetical protein
MEEEADLWADMTDLCRLPVDPEGNPVDLEGEEWPPEAGWGCGDWREPGQRRFTAG